MIQRCGDSLRTLEIPMYLTEAAVNHILGLKNLRVWRFVHIPPPTTLSFPTPFPRIQEFTLSTGKACRWIPWLARREERTPDAQDFPLQYAGLQTTLTRLTFRMSVIVDASFISPLSHFSNLVSLVAELRCWTNCLDYNYRGRIHGYLPIHIRHHINQRLGLEHSRIESPQTPGDTNRFSCRTAACVRSVSFTFCGFSWPVDRE